MPDFELAGPDGAKYQVSAPDEAAALAALSSFSGHGAEPSKVSLDQVVHSAGSGIPILGGLADKANAAIDAAIAPVAPSLMSKPLPQATFGERYTESLKNRAAATRDFEQQHPVIDTAAKIGGGLASFGGALKLAPALAGPLGLEGSLPAMATKGALSGAGIGAADEAVRGGDVAEGAGVGALTGAVGGPLGRGIGKVVQAVRGGGAAGPALPAATMRVGGVEVPIPPQGVNEAGRVEMARKGGSGTEAQRIVEEADAAATAKIKEATDAVGADINGGGVPGAARATAEDAANAVQQELQAAEQTRFQTEQARGQRAALEGDQLHAQAGGTDPATGQPRGVVADSPYTAAETLGAGVQRAAGEARAARTEAYRDYGAVPGEYSPAAFSRISNSMRNRLSGGDSPVRVTDELTPRTADSLRHLDEDVGTLRFHNDAEGRPILDERGQPVPRPITGQTIEEARKVLTQNYGDARRAAMAPGGSQADVRGMNRLIDAFDAHVRDAGRSGAFSGDVAALDAAAERARASHASYRSTFTKQRPGDEVGAAVEKIIGRYENQGATPDEIIKLSYGSATNPGGGDPTRVAQRIRHIFGDNSTEWAAYKQGLNRILDDPALTPVQRADRIDKYLTSPQGRVHSQAVLTPEERTAYAERAQNLRESVPTDLSSLRGVDKIMAKITGRYDGIPASNEEIIKLMYGGAKDAGGKSISVQLAKRLENEMTPEAFAKIRVGLLDHLMERPPGVTEWGPIQQSKNLHTFLHSSLSLQLYPKAAWREELFKLADAIKAQAPPPGATNPSGSAHMGQRMMSAASKTFLPALGMATHGPVGLLTGLAANKVGPAIKNAKAARDVKSLLYKPSPKAVIDPRFAIAGAAISRGLTQGQSGQR